MTCVHKKKKKSKVNRTFFATLRIKISALIMQKRRTTIKTVKISVTHVIIIGFKVDYLINLYRKKMKIKPKNTRQNYTAIWYLPVSTYVQVSYVNCNLGFNNCTNFHFNT